MSALPERTVEAARNGFINAAPQSVWGANTASATATLFAAMDPALGPDRLVVAGPHEQEIIAKVLKWLKDNAPTARYKWGGALLTDEFFEKFGPPSEYEGIEVDYDVARSERSFQYERKEGFLDENA